MTATAAYFYRRFELPWDTTGEEKERLKRIVSICVGIMIVLFSTSVYFLEKDVEGTAFTSVPATFWWCVVTMTTVGYGDVTPLTTWGKVACKCAKRFCRK